MSSTKMEIELKHNRLVNKGWAPLLIFALVLGAAIVWSQPLFGSFFEDGGPWRAVTNVPECANQGRICAEWPFRSGDQQYLAVCCIQANDLGSMESPTSACAPGGMLVIRRGGNAGLAW